MEPGEIYLADFPEAGPHPVIVVSREELNRGHYALVVVCTSARFAVRSQLASCVPFHAGQFGFTADCVAQCENTCLSTNGSWIGRMRAGSARSTRWHGGRLSRRSATSSAPTASQPE
jgi:mRNA-degrading endonuclease toxin of MazEF toxin-antitoxin module